MLELNCEVSMGIALLGLLKVIEYAKTRPQGWACASHRLKR